MSDSSPNPTLISYLTHTWNPVAMRCTPCSPGCVNCWALSYMRRFAGNPAFSDEVRAAYSGEGEPVIVESRLDAPLKMRKPAIIGAQFMGDLFHEQVPFEMARRVFHRMAQAQQHTFMVLTKRPHRMLNFCRSYGVWHGTPWPNNIWPGWTVCNQEEVDRLTPIGLQVPAEHHWISIEPMLERIRIRPESLPFDGHEMCSYHGEWRHTRRKGLDFVALGGETGPHARPMHPDWVRSVRDQCARAEVKFHFKSWGEWAPFGPADERIIMGRNGHVRGKGAETLYEDDYVLYRVGHKQSGHLLTGREHREKPR